MNVKVTYKCSNVDKKHEDRLYKIMCNIIKKDIHENCIEEEKIYEKKCMPNEGFHRHARNISTENSD